jgi:hypothetical protein
MTRTQWHKGVALAKMVNFLGERISDRKLQLFAVACCRAALEVFRDEPSRRAVEVAERYADGLASEEERSAARTALVHKAAAWACVNSRNVAKAVELCLGHLEHDAVRLLLTRDASGPLGAAWAEFHVQARFAQVAASSCLHTFQGRLLREIAGDPFQPVRFDPAWRTPEAIEMARAIYVARDFDQMPYLWDALEEAGCTDLVVRRHLMEPGLHVRGCWALDLVMGKT